MAGPVYALNLFNVADRDEYLAYSRRSAKEVQAHGGRVGGGPRAPPAARRFLGRFHVRRILS